MQYPGKYAKVKKFKFMLENDIFRNSSPNVPGVLRGYF